MSDYLDARWGDLTGIHVGAENAHRCNVRLKILWRALAALTGTQAAPPYMEIVHSPRGLPAVLRPNGRPPQLVWDAGIGTLFDVLSFSLPYDQPAPVTEAFLRKIIAVRTILVGQFEDATLQVMRAEDLLKETPIDRTYQQTVDAEEQFEVWLISELQERFALAHELSHYLRQVDQPAFEQFAADAINAGREGLNGDSPTSILSRSSIDLSDDDFSALWDRELDPYAWYFKDWHQGIDDSVPRATWVDDCRQALHALEKSTPNQREEVVCDLLSALTVALAAHLREDGWTAMMAAACSRLSLSNLEMIMSIDDWVARDSNGAPTSIADISTRQRCLDALLPQMLPEALKNQSKQKIPETGDIREVMHFVEEMHTRKVKAVLSSIAPLPAGANSTIYSRDKILIRSGFLYFRSSPSHTETNRIASKLKFSAGLISYSPKVRSMCREIDQFSTEIEIALQKHQQGNWGDVPSEDADMNNAGLYREFSPVTSADTHRRGALYSRYIICGAQVWIITAANRGETLVLLPSEY